jgi:hypothetical protein
MRNANLQQTLQARDGIAILSVMLIIVILSVATVPMMEVARQTKDRALKQQVEALLNKEAKEYLEIGIYSLQLPAIFPRPAMCVRNRQTPERLQRLASGAFRPSTRTCLAALA